MTTSILNLTRGEILAFRRSVGSLDDRLPRAPRSLRRAGWAGLQDSMPRAALLSIHARVEKTGPAVLEDASLVQVWGPRFSVFVVPKEDVALFTVGRHPDDDARRTRSEDLASRLRDLIGDEKMLHNEAERALGLGGNALRYAATTGTVLIQWDGARQPLIWCVPPPEVDRHEARRDLARRYLHVYGPATSGAFGAWAGISAQAAEDAFNRLRRSITPVRTPIGDAWILTRDEQSFRTIDSHGAPARLLPSGDAYYLHHGDGRRLLVPVVEHRDELWTSRVWPGAVLVKGNVVGTWRRAGAKLTIQTWKALPDEARQAVETEATSLPLPGIEGRISIIWADR